MPSEAEQILAIFEKFDTAKDGTMETDALGKVLQAVDSKAWTKESLDSLFEVIDKKKDGKIKVEDFVKWALAILDQRQTSIRCQHSPCHAPMVRTPMDLAHRAFACAERGGAGVVCRVRCVEGESLGKVTEATLSITFTFNGTEKTMVRKQDEPLSSTLSRMKKSLTPKVKNGSTPALHVNPVVTDGAGNVVPLDCINRDAWLDGHMLCIGETVWRVVRNPPAVTALHVKQPLFEHFGVQAAFSSEFCDAVVFRWSTSAVDTGEWHTVDEGTAAAYTLTHLDVGKRLRVEAVPVGFPPESEEPVFGPPVLLDIAGVVQLQPDVSAYASRLQHITHFNASTSKTDTIRVLTYNLLADNTPAARKGWYAFCDDDALDIHYRKQLLTWEMKQYDADIMCLQEVTPHVFRAYFEPHMRAAGCAACYASKNFTTGMACAVLFKEAKFELLSEHRVDLFREWRGLDAETFPSYAAAWPEQFCLGFGNVNLPRQLMTNLDGSSAVGQIVCLRPKSPSFCPGQEPLFVANAHLMGHPKEELGRVIQASTILGKLHAIMHEVHSLHDAGVVFGGDFNSSPQEAVHRLLRTGRILRCDPVWEDAHRLFAAEPQDPGGQAADASAPGACGDDAAVGDSAGGGAHGPVVDGVDIELKWAFTRGQPHVRRTYIDFRDPPKEAASDGAAAQASEAGEEDHAVDFIYSNRTFKAAAGWGEFPAFDEAALRRHTAIPSLCFGSDHVALLQEFEYAVEA